MKNNYFVVDRGLLHSDRWLTEPFTRGQAWVDLFGLANHTDGFIRVRGIKIPIKRGQLGWSQIHLAERWKWSRGKVRRYLEELENDGDISIETVQQNSKATSIITVQKYDNWQLTGQQVEQQTDNKQDMKRYSNKKNKEEREEREYNLHPPEADAEQVGIVAVIEKFRNTELNPTLSYGNKTQRKAAKEMLVQFGLEAINKIIDFISSPQVLADPYAPRVTTPHQLQEKWGLIRQYYAKLQGKQLKNQVTVID